MSNFFLGVFMGAGLVGMAWYIIPPYLAFSRSCQDYIDAVGTALERQRRRNDV